MKKRLTYYLLFCLFISFHNCSSDEPLIKPEKPEENGKTEQPDETDVLILDPSDIQDYAKIYKPQEFSSMDWLREDSKWSFVRSKQSGHFIVFWEKGFGNNPNAVEVPEALRVDIDDLLEKAETFFSVNTNRLKFAEINNNASNLDKYKMQIYLLYQTEWLATGGGYDDVIGALWVNPSTCKPVGSTIAHEIGHSFQYQVYADLLVTGKTENDFSRGFRYGFGGNGGNAFWEQTAQWQSFQSYPMEAFETYNFGVYTGNCHRHICHEWQRYASYFIHYYWTDKHGIDFIGKLWREAVSPEDPMEAYMRITGLTVDQFNAEMYDAATRFVTWDIDEIRTNGSQYIGKQTYKFYILADGTYQVAYSHCPGTTGYNAVPLNVSEAGTTVSTVFTALQPGSSLAPDDPGQSNENGTSVTVTAYNRSDLTRAGWRYGYVALLKDGQRIYGDMNREASANVEFTIPENCEKLWFVVLGAPSTYKAHAWDEMETNDDQWPYTVKFFGTDILGNIEIDPNATPQDITLTYDLSFPADASAYSGTTVNLIDNGDISKVAKAFVMQPSVISGILLAAKQTSQEGKIAFAAVQSDGSLNYNTTANGHGFWFDGDGNVISWGSENDSKVFSEFSGSSFEFTIGQYPGKCKSGDKYTLKEALIYMREGKQYRVTFIFNITIL
ncbi:hypothetical protein PSM36_1180 [Proteiniphilum saccharofermentans]|uniref:DUF4859 domain-containing protein n=1 Tax=Proteiniphilum saccharofermentans TaxID=1642647 RepID=A0A1R3T8U8_9BACT|nr:DUF4859 domain-containing protein [Proteiniphilum saccharofermentans]SCD20004.1 hypothetical protein PSM36_1180 [Proteiniphilum saccharofermentans]